MARTKRGELPVLAKAQKRADGIRSIDPKMVLEKLTLKGFDETLADARAKLSKYNELLSLVDEALNVVNKAGLAVADLSERMLAGIALKYGKDSDEYEKAGGTKKSERKKPRRKPKN